MSRYETNPPAGGILIVALIFISAIILKEDFINNDQNWWYPAISIGLLMIALVYLRRNRHSNFKNGGVSTITFKHIKGEWKTHKINGAD